MVRSSKINLIQIYSVAYTCCYLLIVILTIMALIGIHMALSNLLSWRHCSKMKVIMY